MASVEIAAAVARSRLKIEWAKNHLNGVEELINQIIADNPSVVAIENDAKTGRTTVRVGPKQFLPVALPLHLGDALHNLNSVMDFLWSGLARDCAPHLASKVTFPRDETRQNLVHRLDDPKGYQAAIQNAFPQAKGFILDGIRPYKRADDLSLIWNLNKVDNINKHRLLIAAAHVIAFKRDLVFVGSDGGRFVQPAGAAIQTQGHPMIISLTAPVKLNYDPEAIVNVVFAEPDHFRGQPVLETLANLFEATTEVVNAFEKCFL